MRDISISNVGGPEHAEHTQIDIPDEGKVLCSCGTTWVAGENDHTDHMQIEDFDAGLVHCSCGASWSLT